MPTSTRFTVAVHILAALALNPGQPVTSEQLAASASTNPAVIRRLLSTLAKAGLTTAQLGIGGGAVLAQAPEIITLLDVYRAAEDTELFAMHRVLPDPSCYVGRNIQPVLQAKFAQAQQALETTLEQVTIAEVATEIQQLAEKQGEFLLKS